MSTDLAVILVLLAIAIAMFVMDKPRMDVVALIMLVALPFTGVVTMNETLAGFSDSDIVLIAALFVIGEGLVRTGVARHIGDWLKAAAGGSETRLIVLLMVAVASLGAFMSSTAVVGNLHPHRAADCAEYWDTTDPANDAIKLRSLDQRHDDSGRNRPKPRR